MSVNNMRAAAKNREWMYVWFAFAGAYSWFNVFFYNGVHNPLSPLLPFMRAINADPGVYLAAVYIPLALAVSACFFFMKDENLSRYRPFWLSVHLALFTCVALLPFLRFVTAFYIGCIVAGALCGLVIYRIFYSLFFFVPAIGWVKMFVLILGALRAGVHLFSFFPPARYPYAMYGAAMLIQAATLFLSLKFRGNVLEVRKNMPQMKPQIKPLIPYMLFMGAIQIFIAALKAFVEPEFEKDLLNLLLNILSSVVTLGFVWFFGDRIKKKETFLRLFFILMMLTFASHQVFGQRGMILTIQFMEPAFLCWDIFFYSILVAIFYTYGKRHIQLRIVLLILFLVLILGQTVLNDLLRGYTHAVSSWFGVIHVASFALFLLIPTVTAKANLSEIVEDTLAPRVIRSDSLLYPEDSANRPPYDANALAALLPAQEKLTEREWEILEQLAGDQDTDVIAYIFHISQNTVRFHIKNICGKFGVSSKAELLRLRRSPGGSSGENSPADIILTKREQDVLRLLITGEDNDEISRKLYISAATIRTHIHNICRKCGVKTRAELIAYMTGKDALQ